MVSDQQQAEFAAAVDRYAAAVAEVDEKAKAAQRSVWAGMVAWESAAATAATAARSADVSKGFQSVAAGLAREYIASVLRAYPGRFSVAPRLALPPVRNGADLTRVYERVADEHVVSLVMSDFAPDSPEAIEAADHAAGVRLEQLTDTDLALTRREASSAAMTSAGVTLSRRILRPELSVTGSCGLCIVAATRIYRAEKLLPIHVHCKCEQSPIIGRDDPGLVLNRDDLDALYAQAGGTSAASLGRIRVKTIQHGEMGPVLVDGAKGSAPARPKKRLLDYTPRTYTPEKAAELIPHAEATLHRLTTGGGKPEWIEFATKHLENLRASA